jgi:predicted site-specific integrase-resolvase
MLKTFTLKDLEKILHVKERTLFRYLKSKKLHGSRGGGKWLFTDEDIKEFLHKGRNKKLPHKK